MKNATTPEPTQEQLRDLANRLDEITEMVRQALARKDAAGS